MAFRVPGGADRTVIIGPTGSGKTVLAAFLLSRQRWEERPWVALDFKEEELWNLVGDPPMRPLRLGDMPGKRGLYRCHVNPWDDDALEWWLMRVWEHGNIGLFCDEAALIPRKKAFKAILRQGRSKRIPVIACTQRPVDCEREVFSESQYRALFGVEDMYRDLPVIRGLFGEKDIREALARRDQLAARHTRDRDMRGRYPLWFDARRKDLTILQPGPEPRIVAADLRAKAPYSWWLGAA